MAKVVELLQWFFFHYASRARTRKCNETKLASSVSFTVFFVSLNFLCCFGQKLFSIVSARDERIYIYIYALSLVATFARWLWLLWAHFPFSYYSFDGLCNCNYGECHMENILSLSLSRVCVCMVRYINIYSRI